MRLKSIVPRLQGFFTVRNLVIGIPMVWLFALAAAPLLLVLDISLAHMDITSVSSLWHWADDELTLKFNFGNYLYLGDDSLYFDTYISSLKFAALTTLYCLIVGYPFAYFISRAPAHLRTVLLMLVMLPFWTSFLLRIYAWKALLADNGVVNHGLAELGLITSPIHMMHTSFSLTIGMVYAYLPFMVLPLYATLVKLDGRMLEAAADLGASPLKTFWLVTVPLTKRGIIAGSLLVFIPAFGEYVIPELLGGARTLMIARVLWDEFFSNNDWPMASAVTIVMILLILVPMALFNRYNDETKLEEKS